ncbi:MAG TPA: SOS response-associated peptidase family protein, partial [Syntrophales bacterium]|nr:SOS response-associated peptidase family protein [Syntrophales bacterium]
RPFHDRMPAIVPADAEDCWLDCGECSRGRLQALLTAYPAEEMDAYDVAPVVNSASHDAPDCIIPASKQPGDVPELPY